MRLIYGPGLNMTEKAGAQMAMKAFARFRIQFDTREFSGADALDNVRMAGYHRKALEAGGELGVEYGEFFAGRESGIIGVSVTTNRLNVRDGGLFAFEHVGIAKYGAGAAISVFDLRQVGKMCAWPGGRKDLHPESHPLALGYAMTRRMGRMFIPEYGTDGVTQDRRFCDDERCLMQDVGDYYDMMDRIAMRGLDFCRRCADTISRTAVELNLC